MKNDVMGPLCSVARTPDFTVDNRVMGGSSSGWNHCSLSRKYPRKVTLRLPAHLSYQRSKKQKVLVLYDGEKHMHSPKGDETDNRVSPHGLGEMCTVSRTCLHDWETINWYHYLYGNYYQPDVDLVKPKA